MSPEDIQRTILGRNVLQSIDFVNKNVGVDPDLDGEDMMVFKL